MKRRDGLNAIGRTVKWFVQACGLLVGVVIMALPSAAQTRVDLVERGRYLVETIAACGHCHTPQRLEDGRQVDLPGLRLAGGYGFEGPVLGRWAGTNITPDPDTGIGRWTEAQVAIAVREGRRPDGSVIGPPMPFAHYRKMSDEDARAIAAYLKSVPSVRNAVNRSSYRIPLPADWDHPSPAYQDRPRATRSPVAPTSSSSATAWIAIRRIAQAADVTGRAPGSGAGP